MKCCSNGIYGARLGVYPMKDNFAEIILNGVKACDSRNLAVITDDLGTTVQGIRRRVFDYVLEIISRAFEIEGHTVANLILSFGCEGDVPETIPNDIDELLTLNRQARDKIHVSCAWSYYPLNTDSHLDIIEKAIAAVDRDKRLTVTRAHYCTRLDGPLFEMFEALENAFETSAAAGIHTVFHLTISKGSPSIPYKKINIKE